MASRFQPGLEKRQKGLYFYKPGVARAVLKTVVFITYLFKRIIYDILQTFLESPPA